MIEKQFLSGPIPDGTTSFNAGFALGKWNFWCQIHSYWYRGTDEDIQIAYTKMLDNYAAKKHLGGTINRALDGRTREGKEAKQEEKSMKDFF